MKPIPPLLSSVPLVASRKNACARASARRSEELDGEALRTVRAVRAEHVQHVLSVAGLLSAPNVGVVKRSP
eukprot:scaffold77982_cov69-Phaeocystis_antarctica.AAC.1